jgi:hypothetical protein
MCTYGGIADGEEVRDMLKLSTALLPGFPRTFLPPFNEGSAVVTLRLDPGVTLEHSMQVGAAAERAGLLVLAFAGGYAWTMWGTFHGNRAIHFWDTFHYYAGAKYFPENLVRHANSILQNKVLFGSDFPLITPDRWLGDFANLTLKDEVRPKILKDNAVRLLGLS